MNSQSMPRFALMLEEAYKARGHEVQVWSPPARVYALLSKGRFSKWAGYIDQYIFFPLWVRKQVKLQPVETLYVFCDQALGPWVPLVKNKPHVVHVHDLLALRSALGEVPENHTSYSGCIYQRYIRQGFQQARYFISISKKTRNDLHRFGEVSPNISEVVYNGLNYPYVPTHFEEGMQQLKNAGLKVQAEGMLLHVSGYQWYKNVTGIVRIYAHYAQSCENPLPLWLVGPHVDAKLQAALDEVPQQGEVLFFYDMNNNLLQAAYSLSRAFLFPSHAEGFGWPIIEALACGCPVITTGEPPMNEVGGSVARYLPRLLVEDDEQAWAKHGAKVLTELLNLDESARANLRAKSLTWARHYEADTAIEGYLNIYCKVVEWEHSHLTKNSEN
jgi:glycosyltransferase involved in cell wall biosynthesis